MALRARACVRVWDRANRSPLDARRSEEHAEREALCVHARVYELERDRQRWLHAAYFVRVRSVRVSVRPRMCAHSHRRARRPHCACTHESASARSCSHARRTHPPTALTHARARARALALRDRHRRAAPHLHGEVVRERRGNATRPHAADGLEAVLLDPADDARLGARRVAGEVAHSAGRARGAAQGQTQGGQVGWVGGGRATRAGSVVVCSGWSWGACARRAPAVAAGGPSGQLLPRAANSSLPSARQNACDRDRGTSLCKPYP